MKPWLKSVFCVTAVVVALQGVSQKAHGHWCDCLWDAAYNIVVKPESDSVVVPSLGTASLVVWVQNNMGYPLVNFSLSRGEVPSGFAVDDIVPVSPLVANYLMPGERQRHTIVLSRTSGSGTLDVADLELFVAFGEGSSQDRDYGNGNTKPQATNHGRDVMKKMGDGSLEPAAAPDLGYCGGQAAQLGPVAVADFGDAETGLDGLLQTYCCGRGSFTAGGARTSEGNSCCSNASTTGSCPTSFRSTTTKYDYGHIFAGEMAAARKSGLSTSQLNNLRQRFACGMADPDQGSFTIAAMALGYLGDESAARTAIEAAIAAGGDNGTIAKAALLLFDVSADRTTYYDDVVAGLGDGNPYVESACATALGIIEGQGRDSTVNDELISRARWDCPAGCDSGDTAYPPAHIAAHLLDLVAWDRRGWAPRGGDTGVVSFYEGLDNVPLLAPTDNEVQAAGAGELSVTWSAVSQNENGEAESAAYYQVYWGTAARPGGCTRPGEMGFDYDHSQTTSNLLTTLTGLTPGVTYHVAVIAVDEAGNPSEYSNEDSAEVAGPPVASISCSPTSGQVPPALTVSCDASGSTDPNGAGDIASYFFRLNSEAEVQDSDGDGIFELQIDSPGNHTVTVRVVDAAGLSGTDSDGVQVTQLSNDAPEAVAVATPQSGTVPPGLQVSFDGSGSSDPNSDPLTYSWDFDDGSALDTSESPDHTFTAPGTYRVVLTVSDDGSPALSDMDAVDVVVSGLAPDATLECSPQSGDVPLTVTCNSTSSSDPNNDITEIYFKLNDQPEALDADGEVTYELTTGGTHTITLRVVDDTGLSDSDTAQVQATVTGNELPIAVAHAEPASGSKPHLVTFTSTGSYDPDGNIVSYSWNFDDGSAAVASSTAVHTYQEAGSYNVTLTVVDDGATPAQSTDTVLVEVNGQAPVASISCSPTTGHAPPDMVVTCNSHQSTDPDGASDIVHHYFTLDSGAAVDETDGEIDYTFSSAQNHIITLRVVDADGLEDSDNARIQISSTANIAPTADAAATPTSGTAPLQVAFSSAGSSDSDGTIVGYSWNFDDGSPVSTEANPNHTFTAAGSFNVTLRVTDDGGFTGNDTVVIQVVSATNTAPDLASATATPLYGLAPLQVQFSADQVIDLEGDSFVLNLDYSDSATASHTVQHGGPSSGAVFQHTFTQNGQYQVELTAQDDGSPAVAPSTKTFIISVTDNQPPDIDPATVTPESGAPPLHIVLDASNCSDPDGDNVTYHWDVAIDYMQSDTFDTSRVDYVIDKTGDIPITLRLSDDGDPPLEAVKTWTIKVSDKKQDKGGDLILSDGCTCVQATTAPPRILLLMPLLGLAILRRRFGR